jgi:5'-methylthioadenosine phosphorylase
MKSKAARIGIIGGSGVENLLFTGDFRERTIKTTYGLVKAKEGIVDDRVVFFLNRHGVHYTPPSLIRYRANVAALKQQKVEVILATAAVGAINRRMRPGDFVTLGDFIDFTSRRIQTFTENSFVELSQPYDPDLTKKISKAAGKLRLKMHKDAVYVCTEGPRFETRSEIKMYEKLGADVVGMTQVPEVILTAEIGVPYAVIGVVTNFAAGISSKKVTSEEVLKVMGDRKEALSRLLALVIKSL